MTLVLSLFPGIGMLDMAFEQEAFCVVRGPDVIWGGDIRKFHPPAVRFDGIIGGPPCQCFSSLVHMIRQNGYEPKFGNLIPEFERCVMEAQPSWFLMENVRGAPIPSVEGYGVWSTLLNNRQLGEVQNRVRRWSFGVRGSGPVPLMIETKALESFEYAPAALGNEWVPVCIGGSGNPKKLRDGKGRMPRNNKSASSFESMKLLQGLPDDFDIPPFKVEAKCQGLRNGVPLAMGRAMAKAVREWQGRLTRKRLGLFASAPDVPAPNIVAN